MSRFSGDDPPDRPVGTDAESFERLFFRYRRRVHLFFARRGFSADKCDDLTQETFLRVYRGLPDLRHETRFETWLFQVARNVLLNEIRSRGTAKRAAIERSLDTILAVDNEAADGHAEVMALPIEKPSVLERILARERTERLSRALVELPPQMRRCAMLRLHGGLSYRDIAALLGISVDAVKSQLFEARARLRAKLTDQYSTLFVEPDH